MLRTPGASNGARWPGPSVGAADTLMAVAPSAATAAPAPAAPSAVTQPRTATRRRCLIMGSGPPEKPWDVPAQLPAARAPRPGHQGGRSSHRGADGRRAGGEPALELVGGQRPGDVEALGHGDSVRADAVERLG